MSKFLTINSDGDMIHATVLARFITLVTDERRSSPVHWRI